MIVHCVKAFNELINCLNLNDNKVPVIIHGFNNNENIARVLVNEGLYFSFGKSAARLRIQCCQGYKKCRPEKFLS